MARAPSQILFLLHPHTLHQADPTVPRTENPQISIFTLDLSPEHQAPVFKSLLEPLPTHPTDFANLACPKVMAFFPHLKPTLPPRFPKLDNDILVVQIKHSLFPSSTPTFNESISLIDFMYQTFLCPVLLISISTASDLARATA